MVFTSESSPSRRSAVYCTALLLLLVVAFVLLTWRMDGGIGLAQAHWMDRVSYPFLNAWPGLLLAGVFLVMTRRVFLSFGLAFLMQGLIYAVNALKVANLGTPLLPDDFRMVGQLRKGGTHLLGSYLPHSPWPYLGLLVGVAVIVAMWRYEPPLFARRTHGKRLMVGAVIGAALLSMLVGLSAWTSIYNGRVLWMEPWSASSTADHSGLISSLMMFHLQYGNGKRKPDKLAASQLINLSTPSLRQDAAAANPSPVQPDIVVIQSESFFDPTIVRGYENSNFAPNLRRLAAHGISGKLHVPTFGGGTIRTEFEVLTGLSLRYFDNLQFPYLQMSHKSMPSLVRTLKAHGYATMALHGNDPSFWNRTTAFKALGFDQFVSQSSFPANAAKDGTYMADSAMTDEIMTQLKDNGPPQFIFAISIEAHGPYDVQPANTAERDAIPVPDGVTGKDKQELQTYLYHLKHADAQLGRLADWMAQRQRPSLILFYGDHLPGLTGSYNTTGFVDGGSMLNQAGTWLLVDPHAKGAPISMDTAAWLLPGKLLEQAGIRNDAYYTLTKLVGPQIAALTAAPGATPPPEDSDQQRVDQAMDSINQLRMNGNLDKLLPSLDAPAGGVAHANSPLAAQQPAVTALSQ